METAATAGLATDTAAAVTATSCWMRAGLTLTPDGRNANRGQPANCCVDAGVEASAHCTAVGVCRLDVTDNIDGELMIDVFNSTELVAQLTAPADDEHVTTSADKGAILLTKDAVRFSSNVFTVRLLFMYRD